MTTYRERRLAKAERLEAWADSREAKADAAFERADQLASLIPLGQPILVGHHSEGRHRRDLDRINTGMDRGLEHSRKAAEMRSRAANIVDAADTAIYSDDPDAPERLAEKIALLEAERARIVAYNKSCRAGKPDLSLLDDRQRRNLESLARHSPYQIRKGGAFPAYATQNLSGRIAAARKRLDLITKGGS